MIDVGRFILGAPDQNSDFAPVHEDKALVLMSDVGAHAATHDAVPGRQIHRIELSLNDLCDVVKHAPLLEGKSDTVDGMLLHISVHICMLHHGVC